MVMTMDERLLKIERDVTRLITLVTVIDERIKRRDEYTSRWRESMNTIIHGVRGSSTDVGVVTEMDRLKQCQARQTWWIRTAIGAVAAFGVALGGWLFHGSK